MNSSVRFKPLPPTEDGKPSETRQEKLRRIQAQVNKGFYTQEDVLRDVADALLMNPSAFENLNEKET
ncbi:MAG: hypothetical protein O2954_20270 [bacterium]|nr:hypothetical protein [bacterium]